MNADLQNRWQNLHLGETATLAFWNLALIGFLTGAVFLTKGIIDNNSGPSCADTYRVTDPRLNAVLFLQDLEEQGLFDPENDAIEDFAWVYEGGQLRFMVALDTGIYTAIACYTDGQALFQDLEVQ